MISAKLKEMICEIEDDCHEISAAEIIEGNLVLEIRSLDDAISEALSSAQVSTAISKKAEARLLLKELRTLC